MIQKVPRFRYEDLRRLATLKMGNQPVGHNLQPTALVHEAYLRLAGSEQKEWQRRSRHFIAAASERIRHILSDAERKKRRLKRGGDWQRIDLEELHLAVKPTPTVCSTSTKPVKTSPTRIRPRPNTLNRSFCSDYPSLKRHKRWDYPDRLLVGSS